MIEDPQKTLYSLLHKLDNNYSTKIVRDLLKTALEEYDNDVKVELLELMEEDRINNE